MLMPDKQTASMQARISISKPNESQAQTCWLLGVPREVLFIVSDQLPAPSRTALALTCKSVFASLCPARRFPPASKEEMASTLLLLEKDAPNWFLCFGCVRLQPLERNSEGGLLGQLHPSCNPVQQSERDNFAPWCWYFPTPSSWVDNVSLLTWKPTVADLGNNDVPEITFSEAHLVMNRHFYGAPHGLPTQHLESVFKLERFIPLTDGKIEIDHFPLASHEQRGRRYSLRPSGQRANAASARLSLEQAATQWTFVHRTSAKVIANELFICRHHSIRGPQCSQIDFFGVIDSLKLPVCRHVPGVSETSMGLHYHGNCIRELGDTIPLTYKGPRVEAHPHDGIGSCAVCPTDYEIAIGRFRGRMSRSLELTTYHKLGSLRTPSDPAWFCITQGHSFSLPAYSRSVGSVREQWLHDGGMTKAVAQEELGGSVTAGPRAHWVFWLEDPGDFFEGCF